MKCQEAKFLISLYIDGELEEDKKITLFQHLSSCPECQEELHQANYLNKLMKSYCYEEEPSSNFSHEVMKKVALAKAGDEEGIAFAPKEKSSAKSVSLFYRFVAVGVAALCFVFLSVSTIFSNPAGSNFLKVSLEESASDTTTATNTTSGFLQKILPPFFENKEQGVGDTKDNTPPEEKEQTEAAAEKNQNNAAGVSAAEDEAGNDAGAENKNKNENNSVNPGNTKENEQGNGTDALNGNNSTEKGNSSAPSSAENEGKVTIAGGTENNLFSFLPLESNQLATAPYFKDKNTLLYLCPEGDSYALIELNLTNNTKKELASLNVNTKDGFSWQNNILSYVKPDGSIAFWGKQAQTLYGFAPLLSQKGYLSYLSDGENNDKLFVSLGEGEAKLIDEGTFIAQAWSTDGNKLAYLKKEGDKLELWLYNLVSNKQNKIVSFAAANGSLGWLPSADEILVAATGGESGLWLVNLDEGKKESLVTLGGEGLLAVSPTGEKVIFVDEKERLMLLNFKGRSYFTLNQVAKGGNFNSISWSTDGSSLAFSQTGKGITLVKIK